MNAWLELIPELSADARQQAYKAIDPTRFLLDQHLASASNILRAQARHYGVPGIDLLRYQPDEESLSSLGEEKARELQAVPLFRANGRLYVAFGKPWELRSQDFVSKLTGHLVEPVLALPQDIENCLNRMLLTSAQSERVMQAISDSTTSQNIQERPDVEAGVLENRDAPTIRMVDRILSQAVRLSASDIHLEPFREEVALRYRIDGVLHTYPGPPKSMWAAVVSRIKISSGLNIAERRLPQDGRSTINVDGRNYDLRVSVIPNLHGEGVVIRVVNPHAVKLDFGSLGFAPKLLQRYKTLLRQPYGVVLVTGPTGSGKSTTLYTSLKHMATGEKKVITLEDPVEYQLNGIVQIQVQPDIGYTFGEGLKAILRHDPDIVLVGEMRDLESAQIAIRAALTGHQIFSTLHTNNAAQALTRLSDMGIPMYQVLASLNGVLAQRLIRRLCPRCKQPDPLEDVSLRRLGLTMEQCRGKVFKAVGCDECNNLGYRGRLAVYELLEITPSIRNLDPETVRCDDLIHMATRDDAFVSLTDSAVECWLNGTTSLDEVRSITMETDKEGL
ncbi:MAG: type II/IV secretion system protein [Candidatus Eremiobacteraeota bacterium]|nr:type II/IV secretion system protein [Candidatus Eremiobacteraeota bacterium]